MVVFHQEIKKVKPAAHQTPILVTIEVVRGKRYRLRGYDVLYEGPTPPPEALRPTLAELGLEMDSRARAPTIASPCHWPWP